MNSRDIVLLSTADWDNPFWTNKQHVAAQLAEMGHRVLYIDSVGLRRLTTTVRDWRRAVHKVWKGIVGPKRVKDRIWVCSPLVVPLHDIKSIRRVNKLALSMQLRLWLRAVAFQRPLLWTYNPLTLELINIDGFPFDAVIYHCVDEIKAQPGMPEDVIERAERTLVARADIVFVTARYLLETRRSWNANTFYFPNVADAEHFGKALERTTVVPEDLSVLPRPRIGFVGAISSYKVDFGLLRHLAMAHPEWSIVLIGQVGEGDPATDVSSLKDLRNVYLLGPRPYEQLPNYLKGMDVGIIPSLKNDYTRAMFPMKFFEYLAAGLPVVATDLPALEEFANVAYLAGTYGEFIRQVETALVENRSVREQRLAVARQYTYKRRTEVMWELVVKTLNDRMG